MKNISKKDNPVPSLDKLINDFDISFNTEGFAENYKHWQILKKRLQYGVENYNEQPKSHKCNICGLTSINKHYH